MIMLLACERRHVGSLTHSPSYSPTYIQRERAPPHESGRMWADLGARGRGCGSWTRARARASAPPDEPELEAGRDGTGHGMGRNCWMGHAEVDGGGLLGKGGVGLECSVYQGRRGGCEWEGRAWSDQGREVRKRVSALGCGWVGELRSGLRWFVLGVERSSQWEVGQRASGFSQCFLFRLLVTVCLLACSLTRSRIPTIQAKGHRRFVQKDSYCCSVTN